MSFDPDVEEVVTRLTERVKDLEREIKSLRSIEYGAAINRLTNAAVYAPNITSLASPSYSLTWNNADGRIHYTALSTGVQFPATQVSSADVNNLDDYEEGTWTPSMSAESGQVGSFTWSAQLGYYTKIGRLAHCMFSMVWTGKPSAGSIVRIDNLPFSADISVVTGGYFGTISGVTFTERGGGTTGTMLSIGSYNTTWAVPIVQGSGMATTDARLNMAQLGTSGTLRGGIFVYAAT